MPHFGTSPSDIDTDQVLDWIKDGLSFVEIAAKLNCSRTTLYRALEASPELVDKSARARESSAEAWLDKGLAVIEQALSKSGDTDPSAARAYAQECARRAAIRNRAYRDKSDVAVEATVRSVKELDDAALAAVVAAAQKPSEST